MILALVLSFFSLTVKAQQITTWSDAIFKNIENEYGLKAKNRIKKIYHIIHANKDKPLIKKLQIANNTFNNIPWIAEKKHRDYWATIIETLTSFGGDSEDIAIAKLVMLYYMGVPKKNLFLAFVRSYKTKKDHMVLIWLNDQKDKALLLDNINKDLLPPKNRQDLFIIYLVNWDGYLIIPNNKGPKKSITAEITGRKLKKLIALKKRSNANNKKYTTLNNGKPLISE
jgi:predicted transglutaminase-like cysteine proteinase